MSKSKVKYVTDRELTIVKIAIPASALSRMERLVKNAQKVVQTAEKGLTKCVTLPFSTSASAKTALLAFGTIGPITYAIVKYIIYRLYFHPLNKLPGPRTGWIPFLGNVPEIVFGESCSKYKEWASEYGGLVRFHGTLNSPRLMITDPQLLKQVLTTHVYDFRKSPTGLAIINRFVGNGVIATEGEVHRQQRRILNPLFSIKELRDLTPLMFVPVVHLANKWINEVISKRTTDDEPVEIIVSEGISYATMDIIGLAGFGEEFNAVRYHGTDRVNKISWGFQTVFDTNKRSIATLLGVIFPILRRFPTERNQAITKAMKAIHEESTDVVKRCIARAKASKNYTEKHLLASMIRLQDGTGNGFTPEEMRIQSLTFLAAGHESAATSVSWCLWLLAKHQDIQNALRAEVTPAFQHLDMNHSVFHENPFVVGFDGANIPSLAAINSLQLLDNVMRESARLIPTVPLTARVTATDVVMNGHVIPKGTYIHLPVIVNHHDKSVWGEDAEEFRPSRWDEEPSSNAGPYDFMPFLAGGHQCIGNRFASIEMKIILAILVMKFQFFERPGFSVRRQNDLTLRPAPNMTLLVKSVMLDQKE